MVPYQAQLSKSSLWEITKVSVLQPGLSFGKVIPEKGPELIF